MSGQQLRYELSAVGGRFTSRSSLEDVEVLHRTPRATVVHVRSKERSELEFALKVFSTPDSAFLAELRHLQGLRHPLVVALEAAFVEDGKAHLLMPFFPRGSIRPWVDDLKPLKGSLGALPAAFLRGAPGMNPVHHRVPEATRLSNDCDL